MTDLKQLNKNGTWVSVRLRPISATRRKIVKDLIVENYRPEVTGIAITGFEDCPEGKTLKNYDLWLGNDILIPVVSGKILNGCSTFGDVELKNNERRTFHSATGFDFEGNAEFSRMMAKNYLKPH